MSGLTPLIITGTAHATVTPLTNDQLVYSGNTSGINIINSDGTGNTVLVSTTTDLYAADPHISPDRTKVYYLGTSNSHLYSINVDGTSRTDLGFQAGSFALSPDGTKIATIGPLWYNAPDGQYYNKIRIENTDGTGASDIQLPQAGNSSQWAWSNDGNSIVFQLRQWHTSYGWDSCYITIAKVNTNGTGFAKLSTDNTGQTADSCSAPNYPSVSPLDGKIAFNIGANTSWSSTTSTIDIMDADGSNLSTWLASSSSPIPTTWSPDGSEIAASCPDSGHTNKFRTCVFNTSSGSLLATGVDYNEHMNYLDWASKPYEVSPLSNDQAVYAANDGIHYVTDDGTGDVLLSNTASNASSPQLSSDRKHIYYVGGSSSHVYKIDVDSRNNTDLGYAAGIFALSADDSKIATIGAPALNATDHQYYPTIKLQNASDGSSPSTITLSTAGSPAEIQWLTSTSLVFQFSSHDDNDEYGASNVWIAKVNTDGSGFTKLTGNDSNQDANPSVDPITGHIAYNTAPGVVHVMHADGTSDSTLVSSSSITLANRPVWSPDGTQIAVDYKDTGMSGTQKVAFIDSTLGTVSHSGPTATKVSYLDW